LNDNPAPIKPESRLKNEEFLKQQLRDQLDDFSVGKYCFIGKKKGSAEKFWNSRVN
jgi:hypothetical protein